MLAKAMLKTRPVTQPKSVRHLQVIRLTSPPGNRRHRNKDLLRSNNCPIAQALWRPERQSGEFGLQFVIQSCSQRQAQASAFRCWPQNVRGALPRPNIAPARTEGHRVMAIWRAAGDRGAVAVGEGIAVPKGAIIPSARRAYNIRFG